MSGISTDNLNYSEYKNQLRRKILNNNNSVFWSTNYSFLVKFSVNNLLNIWKTNYKAVRKNRKKQTKIVYFYVARVAIPWEETYTTLYKKSYKNFRKKLSTVEKKYLKKSYLQ